MFRAGMWVVDGAGRVGICCAHPRAGRQVHLVNPANGKTVKEEPWAEGWRQATRAEIPECRRPSEGVAAKYGYAIER